MIKDADHLDLLIKEMISFDLYKKGKEPLQGIDPKDRIKRSIWRDDGVDLKLLEREGISFSKEMDETGILISEEAIVKEGLFRKRRPHRIMKELVPLDQIFEKMFTRQEVKDLRNRKMINGSELLFPVALFRTTEVLRTSGSVVSVPRNIQRETMDISPRSAVRSLLQGRKVENGDDDLTRIFDRTLEEKHRVRTRTGSRIMDLKTMISVVLTIPDTDLVDLLERGVLLKLARDGFRNPRMEGLLTDLSLDENGSPESPERFRLRLGRSMMESEIAGEVYSKIAVPLLGRFRSCSRSEASKLRVYLGPLMGLRASPLLSELVFSVPSDNRTFIIDLMGETGDPNLLETLKRIEGFSTIEDDRKAARTALVALGEG